MRRAQFAKLALATAGVATALLIAEAALQAQAAWRERAGGVPAPPPRYLSCGDDCGYAYGLNPARPEVSDQGLWDRRYAIPKPAGVTRILVLGDSVAQGHGLRPQWAFPDVLERGLDRPRRPVEVVNAAAAGYTTWNEVRWYEERGGDFGADVVVLALCLNDVVDPALHWDHLGRVIDRVPESAIPNPAYHDRHVRPLLRRYRLEHSPSRLVRVFASRWNRWRHDRAYQRDGWEEIDGRRVPVFLTTEDTLPIHVLLDAHSPEWQWLRGLLERLHARVRADGAHLLLLVLPLAYQLDPDYPYLPQRVFERVCGELGLRCLDALPTLRGHPPEAMFLLDRSGYQDVWHLTRRGHRAVANALEATLLREGLVPE